VIAGLVSSFLVAFPTGDRQAKLVARYQPVSLAAMAGLGTLLILLMGVATLLQWHDVLLRSRPVLWMLMLAFPFPYIATTAGWMTAELGRQPWIVYG
jgi:cytochrome d ubiquinol oxidase subunit I